MYDVVLTVPHGHADNDRAAEAVARALHKALTAHDEWGKSLETALIVNRLNRRTKDGNRPESRGRAFRAAITEELSKGARLMIDVHSFKPTSRRFHGKDIVLLHTPGLQSLAFLKRYAGLLRSSGVALRYPDVRVEVEPAKYVDDVCIQAREVGVKANALMLAEHNDLDHPQLAAEVYSAMHAMAIRKLLDKRARKAPGGDA